MHKAIYLYGGPETRINVCCVCIDDSPLFDSFDSWVCVWALSVRWMNTHMHAHIYVHTFMSSYTYSFVLYTFAQPYSMDVPFWAQNSTTIMCCVFACLSFRLCVFPLSFLIKSNGNYFNFWPKKTTISNHDKKKNIRRNCYDTDCLPDFMCMCVL